MRQTLTRALTVRLSDYETKLEAHVRTHASTHTRTMHGLQPYVPRIESRTHRIGRQAEDVRPCRSIARWDRQAWIPRLPACIPIFMCVRMCMHVHIHLCVRYLIRLDTKVRRWITNSSILWTQIHQTRNYGPMFSPSMVALLSWS